MTRHSRIFFAFLLAAGPFAWAACKKEEPPPTPTVTEEEDEKPKKKKKKVDDEETQDTGGVGDPDPAATGTATGAGTAWKAAPKTDSGSTAASDAAKAKLIACCTALRNAANAAGIANSAMPGMPAPPPKEQLDKSVAECDKQVVNWNGDLNTSLKSVKGASPVALPAGCSI